MDSHGVSRQQDPDSHVRFLLSIEICLPVLSISIFLSQVLVQELLLRKRYIKVLIRVLGMDSLHTNLECER